METIVKSRLTDRYPQVLTSLWSFGIAFIMTTLIFLLGRYNSQDKHIDDDFVPIILLICSLLLGVISGFFQKNKGLSRVPVVSSPYAFVGLTALFFGGISLLMATYKSPVAVGWVEITLFLTISSYISIFTIIIPFLTGYFISKTAEEKFHKKN